MKKLLFALILLIGIFAISNSVIYAQTKTKAKSASDDAKPSGPIKIGVVDIQTIVTSLPEATEANKVISDLKQKYRDSLLAIQKDYTSKRESYEKQKSMMPADKQKESEEQLKALENQYMQFQEEKFGNQGELIQLTEKYLAPIRKKVKDAIQVIAVEEGMSFVFDKETNNAVLLYSDDSYDITYKVLDKIKRSPRQ
jgi:Skp family chaperone for outer membrane proteins